MYSLSNSLAGISGVICKYTESAWEEIKEHPAAAAVTIGTIATVAMLSAAQRAGYLPSSSRCISILDQGSSNLTSLFSRLLAAYRRTPTEGTVREDEIPAPQPIVPELVPVPAPEPADVMSQIRALIAEAPSTTDQEINALLEEHAEDYSQVPKDEMFAAIQLARGLMTKEMSASDRSRLLWAVLEVPVEKRGAVIQGISPLIDDQMNAEGRVRVIEVADLPEPYKGHIVREARSLNFGKIGESRSVLIETIDWLSNRFHKSFKDQILQEVALSVTNEMTSLEIVNKIRSVAKKFKFPWKNEELIRELTDKDAERSEHPNGKIGIDKSVFEEILRDFAKFPEEEVIEAVGLLRDWKFSLDHLTGENKRRLVLKLLQFSRENRPSACYHLAHSNVEYLLLVSQSIHKPTPPQ